MIQFLITESIRSTRFNGGWKLCELPLMNVTKEEFPRSWIWLFLEVRDSPQDVCLCEWFWTTTPSPGICHLAFHCKGMVDLYGDTESKGENSQGEIALKERFKLSGTEKKGRRKAQTAAAFTSIFRGQCCQQGLQSRMGRFSQLQAEPEVRNRDPGHEPVPRQIGFVEERKTLPRSTSDNF